MSDTVIRVENLSKKYIIRHQQAQQYTALRDVIADGVKSIGRRLSGAKQDPAMGSTQEEFWALKDVSFEVKQGDRIGIIGRNGAGKSTLLKILSRIVEPTEGKITLNGRVASLLEVGTGFHPELTGRENIYLNGAILGMSQVEIRRKFDEIVAFAETEKFLDTPVKKYSSGMYVRLAFSVAAHLEPEILIVDEVLAVGDTAFQKKCLGKMEDISNKEKRTVIFVSHNMGAVKKICNRGIFLDKGIIEMDNTAFNAVDSYLTNDLSRNTSKRIEDHEKPCIVEANICNFIGENIETLNGKDRYYLKLKVFSNKDKNIVFGFTVFNSEDVGIFSGLTSDYIESIPAGLSLLKIELPIDLLHPGSYRVEGALADSKGTIYEQSECFTVFTCLRDEKFYLDGGKSRGLIRISCPWEIDLIESLMIT
jgi:lipopolysaccharide transport system ATP-binding protein